MEKLGAKIFLSIYLFELLFFLLHLYSVYLSCSELFSFTLLTPFKCTVIDPGGENQELHIIGSL